MTDAKPSKSAKKRQYHALQDVGERLIELTDEQLGQIDTDEQLIEQVKIAKKMSAHGALRRQKQLIGKLMRNIDSAPILSLRLNSSVEPNKSRRPFSAMRNVGATDWRMKAAMP